MRVHINRIMIYLIGGATLMTVMIFLQPMFDENRDTQAMTKTIYNIRKMKHSLHGRDEIYKQRRNLVSKICSSTERKSQHLKYKKPLGSDQLRHILVDDVNKVLYCEIPNVGSTGWRWAMLHATGITKSHNLTAIDRVNVHNGKYKHSLPTLATYNVVQRKHRLRSYFKFMFARHPYERLLSTYIDKFTTKPDKYFLQRFGRYIIRTYRTRPSEIDVKYGRGVTFREFLRFVIDSYRKRIPLDRHWRTYQQLCHPCSISYDVIGQYGDSLADDVSIVLDWMNIPNQIAKTFAIPDVNKTANKMKRFYQDVPLRTLHRMSKVFETDLLMFNYTTEAGLPSWTDSLRSLVFKYFHWKS